jgi:hypothetical protein
VTTSAQGNQIEIVIRALLAAKVLVMDLHVLPRATDLASPAIATQNLFSDLVVWLGIKPQPQLLGSDSGHEAFPGYLCRNAAVVRRGGI